MSTNPDQGVFDPFNLHTVGKGPFDKFIKQSDFAENADYLTARAFDRGTDIRPFLRQPGVLPYDSPASKDAWLDKELGPILRQLDLDRRVCAYCNVVYKNLDNIGRWQCSWHPAQVNGDNVYTCCGKSAPAMGCLRCDHNSLWEPNKSRWNDENTMIDVPISTLEVLRCDRTSIIAEGVNTSNPARSVYRLRRTQIY